MEEISNTFAVYQTVFGVIGLLATALAIFRSTYLKQTIELLRSDKEDLDKRLDSAKDERAEFEAKANKEKRELQDQILLYETALTEKNQEVLVLRNVVTGKEQLDRIENTMTALTKELRGLISHDKANGIG